MTKGNDELTELSSEYGHQHLRDDVRQHVHPTHQRRCVSYILEVNGQVIAGDEEGPGKEQACRTARPHDCLPQDGEWYHCLITLSIVPRKPHDKRTAGTAEETDDRGAVPGILIPAILQRKEELNRSGSEKREAKEVEFAPCFSQHDPPAWFGYVVRDTKADEEK